MKLKIKKGSKVQVITGAAKGPAERTVLEVDPVRMRVRVEGVKMQTRHSKQDGLVKSEGYIHYSNVKLVESAAPKKKSGGKKATKEKSA